MPTPKNSTGRYVCPDCPEATVFYAEATVSIDPQGKILDNEIDGQYVDVRCSRCEGPAQWRNET